MPDTAGPTRVISSATRQGIPLAPARDLDQIGVVQQPNLRMNCNAAVGLGRPPAGAESRRLHPGRP